MFRCNGPDGAFSPHFAGRATMTTENSRNDAKAFSRASISLDMQDV